MSEPRGPAPPSATAHPAAAGGDADATSPLARIVALEAHRADVGFRPDPQRLAEGWTFRFVADGRRAAETVALYEELGYETCAAPLDDTPVAPGCAECRLAAAFDFRAIYTRRPGAG